MKLFHQLSEKQQLDIQNKCLSKVISELLSGSIQITFESSDLEKQIAELIEDALQIPQSEREEFLLKNELSNDLLHDLAMEMAKTAFYHDPTELIFWIDDSDEIDNSSLSKKWN